MQFLTESNFLHLIHFLPLEFFKKFDPYSKMASPFCGNNEKKINLKEEIEKKMNCLDDDEENEEKIIKNTQKNFIAYIIKRSY